MRVFTSFFILAISLALVSQPAKATSFPITGTSEIDGSILNDFVTGGPLFLDTDAPSGPLTVGNPLNPGIQHYSVGVAMFSALNGGVGFVTYGNQTTDLVSGVLIFSGTFTLPAQPDLADFTTTFPVSFIGNGIAYQDLSAPGQLVIGPLIFDLAFKGSGTITLQGIFLNGQYFVEGARASFNGTATVVPEPSSLLLFGTGLAGLVGMRHKLMANLVRLR